MIDVLTTNNCEDMELYAVEMSEGIKLRVFAMSATHAKQQAEQAWPELRIEGCREVGQ